VKGILKAVDIHLHAVPHNDAVSVGADSEPIRDGDTISP
jgi:hypothetical protein